MDWSKWKKLFSHISVEEIVPALLVLVVGLIVIKLLLKLLDTALRRSNLEKTAYTLLRSFPEISAAVGYINRRFIPHIINGGNSAIFCF